MTDFFGRKGPRPTLGCDSVIFLNRSDGLNVLLIRRGNDPFKGNWALPGGFMEWGESCEQAAARELEEETGLKGVELKQFGVFSAPGRDPRGTIVSVAFFGSLKNASLKIKASDDAKQADWFPVKKHPPLAFDHELVLKNALQCFKKS